MNVSSSTSFDSLDKNNFETWLAEKDILNDFEKEDISKFWNYLKGQFGLKIKKVDIKEDWLSNEAKGNLPYKIRDALRNWAGLAPPQQLNSQQEKNLIVTLAKEDRKSLVKDIVKNLKRKYNPWEITSSQRTQSEQENFRKDLIQYYQCDDGTGKIRCMLLNQHFQKKVIAAHLIPCASKNTFEDIDLDPDALFNVRNGLMLYESIEKAFDRLDVCFWWDSVENDPMKKLKFLVLDPNLKATKVVVDPTLNISTTFQDLNNQPLNVPQENGKPKYPYLRVLNWHGKCAIQKAISRSWIPKSYQYEDFYSHSVSSKTFNFNNEDLD
jgi:hypothetical protein